MKKLIPAVLALILLFSSCAQSESIGFGSVSADDHPAGVVNDIGHNAPSQAETSDIPEFSGDPYCVLNNNVPDFDACASVEPFEDYSDLDSLGRCGVAYACLGLETMPAAGENPDSSRLDIQTGIFVNRSKFLCIESRTKKRKILATTNHVYKEESQ